MSARRLFLLAMLVALAVLQATSSAAAATGPLYDIKALWGDTNLTPGGEGQFTLQARNIGDASGSEALTITDQLPPALTITGIASTETPASLASKCKGIGSSILTCTVPASEVGFYAPAPGIQGGGSDLMPSGYLPKLFIDVIANSAASGIQTNTATIAGGGAAAPATDVDQVPFGSTPSVFGIVPGSYEADFFNAAYPFGARVRRAGAHPFELRLNFDLNEKTGIDPVDHLRYSVANGLIKDAEVTLPRGMIGNPEAMPKCDPVVFSSQGSTSDSTACPSDTQVGYLNVSLTASTANRGSSQFNNPNTVAERVAIYNLVPPRGTPVDFGFQAGTFIQGHIFAQLDPAQNYAIKTLTPDITSFTVARSAQVTFWGVPADPAHDRFRYYAHEQEDGDGAGAPWGSAPIRPFFTLPTDCGTENGGGTIRVDSYEHPGEFTPAQEESHSLDVEGCEDPRFRFEPKVALQPTDRHAGAPTGLDVHLEVPQRDDEVENAEELYAQNGAVKAIPTPPLKKAVVTLPEGMTLSPSAAQGLGSCTAAEIGLGTNEPVRCPDDSQYGTLTLHTPILPEDAPPKGFIYIAKQGENPFHNFLSIYLVIEEPQRGVLVKIPGRVDLDPETGQITTSFEDLPQFPVSDIQMTFKGGVRAGLVEPSTCGKKTIRAEFFSWQDPSTSHVVNSSYEVTERPNGAPCVANLGERPFKPSFEAGTTNNVAGRYSPFALRLTRTDEDQELSQLALTLPPGLTAKLAGVAECPEAGIARAEGRKEAGEGALEQLNPSCPASSQIGTTQVGAGVGVPLTWVPGKVYLAGPYRGAPLSIIAISPVIVGPFDLGVVVVRTALNVNHETAQGEATSDPLPQIFQGIPVRIRDLRLDLGRPDFTLNPTSCAEKQVKANVRGTGGDVHSSADDSSVALSDRFQAADCARLGFKPKLSLRLSSGTRRAHPGLHARVTYPKRGAYANIAAASVTLPRSEFLDQSHIRTVCTRVQFAAGQCPAASVYGHAVAKSPLFDFPLQGPVYLRSSSHELPDLVAALRGPASMPIEVDLDGRIDSVEGGIRNTFSVVPDAPVESFTLTMRGAKKGLLQNSVDLCAKTYRATAKFKAQNGKRITERPALRDSCGARHRGHRGHSHHR